MASLDYEELYKNLKLEYDDFVDSSKEIENELEIALNEKDSKINDLLKKLNQNEDKLQSSQLKYSQVTQDTVKVNRIYNISTFD